MSATSRDPRLSAPYCAPQEKAWLLSLCRPRVLGVSWEWSRTSPRPRTLVWTWCPPQSLRGADPAWPGLQAGPGCLPSPTAVPSPRPRPSLCCARPPCLRGCRPSLTSTCDREGWDRPVPGEKRPVARAGLHGASAASGRLSVQGRVPGACSGGKEGRHRVTARGLGR